MLFRSKTITGTIDRVAVLSNQNKVMFTLKGRPKTVYTINLNDYANAALSRPNDKVKFKANVVDNKSVGNVSKWTNCNLK